MREIKFRAWQKGNSIRRAEMLIPSVVNCIRYFREDNYNSVSVVKGYDNHYTLIGEEEVILMQYTGLKDKNGKEIYEGDLLRWWNGRELIGSTKVVESTSGGWNPFIDDCQTDGSWHYKVIGNIYENPELLNSQSSYAN